MGELDGDRGDDHGVRNRPLPGLLMAQPITIQSGYSGMALPGKPVLHGKRWIIPVGYTDLWETSNIAAGLAATAIPPMLNNAYNPRIYDGSLFKSADIQSANGGAAGARYAVSYRSRCVLANGPKYPRRLFFSSAGQGTRTNWLDPDAWVDMPVHVTGMCSLPTSLLVFGYDRAIRIRGDTPPPLSDLDRKSVV